MQLAISTYRARFSRNLSNIPKELREQQRQLGETADLKVGRDIRPRRLAAEIVPAAADARVARPADIRAQAVAHEQRPLPLEAWDAADAAREWRNKLLDDCDNMMVPDRPGVDVPAWTEYRQALRDIPEQDGFPLAIVWPETP